MDLERACRHHMPVDVHFVGREAERQTDQLRQVQDRHFELLAEVFLDFTLKPVENRVAEGTWGHHSLRTAGFCRQNVLAGQFDCHALVVRGRVKAAALVAPTVVDRSATEHLGQLFERDVISGVDKTVASWRACNVAALECRDSQVCERVDHHLTQPLLANIFIQNPKEVADARAAAVVQAFLRQLRIDGSR